MLDCVYLYVNKRSMKKHSTILIRGTTREHLKQFGSKGQTYDEIIIELIKRVNERDSLDSRLTDLQSSESGGQ